MSYPTHERGQKLDPAGAASLPGPATHLPPPPPASFGAPGQRPAITGGYPLLVLTDDSQLTRWTVDVPSAETYEQALVDLLKVIRRGEVICGRSWIGVAALLPAHIVAIQDKATAEELP